MHQNTYQETTSKILTDSRGKDRFVSWCLALLTFLVSWDLVLNVTPKTGPASIKWVRPAFSLRQPKSSDHSDRTCIIRRIGVFAHRWLGSRVGIWKVRPCIMWQFNNIYEVALFLDAPLHSHTSCLAYLLELDRFLWSISLAASLGIWYFRLVSPWAQSGLTSPDNVL